MDQLKLWVTLFLLSFVCFNIKETVVTIPRKEPYASQICSNGTVDILTLIVCNVTTQSKREMCRLLYKYGQGFQNECGSNFTLLKKNRTVFLHLTNLKPEDGGKYSCECSHARGTDILNLSITVGGDEEVITSLAILCAITVIAVVTAVIIIGVLIGLTLRKRHYRVYGRRQQSGLSGSKTSCSLDPDKPEKLYASLQLPTSGIYQTISAVQPQQDTKTFSVGNNIDAVCLEQKTDESQTEENVYESIEAKSQDTFMNT